jgi:hypothetical protein
MGRLDTSKPGELRALAEELRRRAREMTLPNYIAMMRRAADELDAEAREIDGDRRKRPGEQLDITI